MTVEDHVAVRDELARILAGSTFRRSPRMSRFLSFVVETALAGSADALKEYVIAVEVFDKPPDYDPQADSTVRTEAGKLRARLARYYESEGRDDTIRIWIPKGGYAPSFEHRAETTADKDVENLSVLPGTPPPESAETPPRYGWLRGAGAVAGLAATAAGLVLWFSGRQERPAPVLFPLTTDPALEEQPSLSPDGSQVAYRWKGDIYVRPTTGEAFIQLTSHPAHESSPAWSPDGRHIAFVRNREVFLISPLGGAETRVGESDGRIAWTHDSTSLLVTRSTSEQSRSIFRLDVRTGDSQRLTFAAGPSRGDVEAAASPDGKWIAFCRSTTGEGCELHVIPSGGGEPRKLTNAARPIQGFAWTADSREIVYATNTRGWFRLFRLPAAGTGLGSSLVTPVLVEGAGDDARFPSISRNNTLVYQRFVRNFDIHRAELAGEEGSSSHRIISSAPLINSTRIDAAGKWSPDGSKIAFKSDRSGTQELWICDSDGSNPRMLTSFGGPHIISHEWSPDGTRLVLSATTSADGNFESWIVPASGGPAVRVSSSGRRTMAHPVFSRDGLSLYFIPGPQDGPIDVWRMPTSGGPAVRITTNGAFRPQESRDGGTLYYGKVGTPGIWSTPVAGGPERQVVQSTVDVNWTLGDRGIYFFESPRTAAAPIDVMHYSFVAGSTRRLGKVEPTSATGDFAGISVSRNGRWMLYSQLASASSDLMILRSFQ